MIDDLYCLTTQCLSEKSNSNDGTSNFRFLLCFCIFVVTENILRNSLKGTLQNS